MLANNSVDQLSSSSLFAELSILSGGQTGVDRAALDAAMASGVGAGGWCPEDRKAEDGPIDGKYPLQVLPGAGYQQRTLKNVQDSDGTVIIYFATLSGGTELTRRYCVNESKPHLLINGLEIPDAQAAQQVVAFIHDYDIKILNVAGPRASKEPRGYPYTYQVIKSMGKWAKCPLDSQCDIPG